MRANDKKSVQYCPSCDNEITAKEINISQGVALCEKCGTLSQLSDLNYSGATTEETLSQLPKGITLNSGYDSVEIRVSLFSFPQFLGSLFISLFWNGIVSIFLSIAAAAVYYNLFGPLPDWIPAPGLNEGKPIMNDKVMGPGMTIFLCLFLTPFVAIGTGMIINTLLRLIGTTQIVIAPSQSFVSTGISFLRLKRHFDARQVKSITSGVNIRSRGDDQVSYQIEIETTKTMKFGGMLSRKQQEWIVAYLKQIFFHRQSSKFAQLIPNLPWLNSPQ